MSRALYESILEGEAFLGAEGLLAAFAAAASTVRAEGASGLAQAEFEEGLHLDDRATPWLDADLDGLSVAARDEADLDFPVRYRGAGRTVLLGLDEDGECYALLESGAGPVEVLGVVLAVGVEVRIDLESPPAALRLEDGTVLLP